MIMVRSTTKIDLIETCQTNYLELMTLITEMPEEKRNAIFSFDLEKEKGAHWRRDRNLRDVLIHLYEWHCLLLHWVSANQSGVVTTFLPEGYNWKTYGEMNQKFWETHQETSFEEAFACFQESHQQVRLLIETFSNEELFLKNVYPWTDGSTLGSYFVSATGSHYNWAVKKIRKHQRIMKKQSK